MKKSVLSIAIFACSILVLSFVSCSKKSNSSSLAKSKTISVSSINQNAQNIQVEVPLNAQRVVVLDLAVLDYLDNFGLADKITGSVSTNIEYLKKYADDPKIIKCGNVKEVDFEKILEAAPDIIFAGGRLQTSYDKLAQIAPTVILPSLTDKGLYESVKFNATEVAKIWGKEDQVSKLTENFASRIQTLKNAAQGKTAIVAMCTNGGFNVLGNNGRCSIIGNEIGFENVGVEFAQTHGRGSRNTNTPMHGNEVSFEFVVQKNPDFVFVMDRDSAIGAKGAKLAAQIMNNELINSTRAAKEGHVIVLEHSDVWYTAEGGITAFDIMLQDLESTVLK